MQIFQQPKISASNRQLVTCEVMFSTRYKTVALARVTQQSGITNKRTCPQIASKQYDTTVCI